MFVDIYMALSSARPFNCFSLFLNKIEKVKIRNEMLKSGVYIELISGRLTIGILIVSSERDASLTVQHMQTWWHGASPCVSGSNDWRHRVQSMPHVMENVPKVVYMSLFPVSWLPRSSSKQH